MSSTNKAVPSERTYEGGRIGRITPELELRRTIMAHMLWEDSFYESGEDASRRLATLIPQVDAAKVHAMAVEARTKMKLRHVPLFIAVECAKHETHRKNLASMVEQIIQRPDELTELLAIYSRGRSGRKVLNKLSKQLQKGLKAAFGKFNEYSFAKYNQSDKAIKLRDALFLAHPDYKNEEQKRLYDKIASNQLSTPDTWEVALSAGGKTGDKKAIWGRLLADNKLGALALLRNLRNMQQAGVELDLIRSALSRASVERVLPFRFISAAQYAPRLEPELEQLMFKSLEGAPKLPGTTALVIDCSGSMRNTRISAKSELDRLGAASALAILARELCEHANVYAFHDKAFVIPSRRGFALRDAINAVGSGGSRGGLAVQQANKDGYDRIIVLTDGEWHPMDPNARTTWAGDVNPTDGKVSPQPLDGKPAYMLNVAGYKNGVGYGRWTSIDGWSEAVLQYIVALEQGIGDEAQ